MVEQIRGDEEELKPAPAPLRLVQKFINTHDLDRGTEELEDPSSLAAWLDGEGVIRRSAATVGPADLERAVELREALRALLVAKNGGDADRQAIGTLNRLSRELPIEVRFDEAGSARLVARTDTVEGALGYLLGLVLYARADGTWERLKACGNPGCRWAFYDASKNRVGTWCDMAVCGNRNKSRAHRERQRAERTVRS